MGFQFLLRILTNPDQNLLQIVSSGDDWFSLEEALKNKTFSRNENHNF